MAPTAAFPICSSRDPRATAARLTPTGIYGGAADLSAAALSVGDGGSWAGAFGQTQFTPTTFKYAADGDGDGQSILALTARCPGLGGAASNRLGAGNPGACRLPDDFAMKVRTDKKLVESWWR
jgi:hypothetical protein